MLQNKKLSKKQIINQRRLFVSLMPTLEQRYRHLRDLLEESMTQDIELWRIELARADCLAVVNALKSSSSKRVMGKLRVSGGCFRAGTRAHPARLKAV